MSGIKISSKGSKMPRALKLLSSISSYLFEEEFRECQYFKQSELEALRKAAKAISKAHGRSMKK